MKSLTEFINEALKKGDLEFSTRDLIDNNVWVPNENYRKMDSQEICNNFYKKYPKDKNNCGMVDGYQVKCQYNLHPAVVFTVFCDGASEADKIGVVEEIINFLTNEIASTAPGKNNPQSIKAMLNKI